FEQRLVAFGPRRGQRQQVTQPRDVAARDPAYGAIQTRLNSSVPLVPPKPNELEIATSILPSRAVFGTKSRSQPSPGSSRLMVGGSTLSRIASNVKIASTPPAAPSRWPVTDLVELIASFFAWSPNTRLAACTSPRSPSGVEVPCALMYCTAVGSTPASFTAAAMQRAAPSPPSLGAVMWYASSLMPKPASSA